MKCPHSAPPTPANNAARMKARQRSAGMLAPMAAAARSSSRLARSSRPVRDSLKASAAISAITATSAARGRSVAFGRPNNVRGPLVSALQLVIAV